LWGARLYDGVHALSVYFMFPQVHLYLLIIWGSGLAAFIQARNINAIGSTKTINLAKSANLQGTFNSTTVRVVASAGRGDTIILQI